MIELPYWIENKKSTIILHKRKKYLFTFAQSDYSDQRNKMNYKKVHMNTFGRALHKLGAKVFYALRSFNCPLLRFRRPILPRA